MALIVSLFAQELRRDWYFTELTMKKMKTQLITLNTREIPWQLSPFSLQSNPTKRKEVTEKEISIEKAEKELHISFFIVQISNMTEKLRIFLFGSIFLSFLFWIKFHNSSGAIWP